MSTKTNENSGVAHFDETRIEELVAGVEATSEHLAHLEQCAECRATLQDAKRLYNQTASLFSQDDGLEELLSSDAISHMISRAMVHAPPTFSRRAWWLNMALGGLLTSFAGLALLALEMPRLLETLRSLGAFRSVPSVLYRAVAHGVPGGWATVALVGVSLLCLMALPLVRRLENIGSGLATMLAALLLVLTPFTVSAQDEAVAFEGDFSDLNPVTLQLEEANVDDALGQVCEQVGLGYISRSRTLTNLPTIPSLRLRNTPVEDALRAILGDAQVSIERHGNLVTVDDRAQLNTAAAATNDKPLPAASKPARDQNTEAATDVPRKEVGDIFAFGENRTVAKDEVADSVSIIGGNVTIEGLVREDVSVVGGNADISGIIQGDLVTTGGNATVSGRIEGDAAAMGGNISVVEGGKIVGELGSVGGNIKGRERQTKDSEFAHGARSDASSDDDDNEHHGVGSFLHSLVNHVLIFLIGLLMMGVAGGRFGEMKRALAATPVHSLGFGVLGFFGALVLTVVLCITLIGIPIALCVIVVSFAAFFVGLAAVAATVGKVLPVPQLRKRPIVQLAVGIAILFILSLAPMGELLLFGLATAGFGAVMVTRFGGRPYPTIAS